MPQLNHSISVRASDQALDLIREAEGLELEAYKCPAGVWTIGYGHTRNVHQGDSITASEAERRLREDVRDAEDDLTRLVRVPLSQGQHDALVSFVFNLGGEALEESTLLRKLNAGDFTGAAKELDRWVHSDGKVLPGLVTRRAAERELFESEA